MSKKYVYLPVKCSKILHFLFENRIASAKIIHSYLFPENHIRGVNKHLKRLVDLDFIERRFITNENLRCLTLYSLTKSGFKYGLPEIEEVKNIEIKSGKVKHDLMALRVRQRMSKLARVNQVWSENQIHFESEYFEEDHFQELSLIRADGALAMYSNNRTHYIALEYEASTKTKARNKSKLRTYTYMRGVSATLYVCKDKYIMNSLKKAEREYINSSHREFSNIDYGLLEQVLDESQSPDFENVFDEKFPDLSEEKKKGNKPVKQVQVEGT